MQLYHNANVSDVDSLSTHSDGTKWQQKWKGEGEGKDADIGYKSTLVVGSGPYKGIHLGTHLWTHTDIQCLRRYAREEMGPLYDIIILDPVTTRHFSQFQLMWPHRGRRSSHFREWRAAFRSYMGQMFDKTCDQMNNWRWNNPDAFGDQVDRSNPQTTSSGKVKRTSECFSWYSSDDLRAKIEPPSCRQYKPDDFLAVRPLNWDEIINEDDDDKNWEDPGAPSGGSSRPGDSNDHDNGEGEEDTQGGEKRTRKGKGTKDWKGKGKGKGKGNGKGKAIVKQTPGGDDISRAVALQLQKERYEADSGTEG